MQDEHRPRTFADDEVALPVAGLAAAFNGLRTIMDRRSILDGVARGSGATRATAFVATRQITPQGLGLLCGPIDEGVDCLAADGPQPRFVPGFQPAGDLLGRPSLGEPIRWIPTRSATPSTASVPQRKVGFPIPNAGLLLGFQGTKTARRGGISSPFSDAGGCTSPQNSGSPTNRRKAASRSRI